ncbi:MAG: hypothetical protein U5L96_04920 [Owenweeksia sp.]|nr:hypothetical protein [Owenweeksia sp.]
MLAMNSRKANLLFVLGSVIFSIYYLDWSLGWNPVSRMALPLSLALEGNWQIDTFSAYTGDAAHINGHYYSDKAPLPGLLMLPVIYLAKWFTPLSQLPVVEQLQWANALGALFLGSLPFVISLVKVQKMLGEDFPRWLSLLFFFGSFLFVFAGSAYSHALAGLLVLLSFESFQKNRPGWSGFFIGAAFCTEYTTIVFGALWGLYFLLNKSFKSTFLLGLAVVPFLLFQAWYNWHLSGSALDFAYKFQEGFKMNATHYGFGWPSLKAFYHLSISPYRGLFFYAPLLLPLLFFNKNLGIAQWWKKPLAFGLIASLAYLLLFSFSKSWYGGWTFGPRYLYPVALLLFVALGKDLFLSKRGQSIAVIVGTLGLLHTFADKVSVLYPPTEYLYPSVQFILPAIGHGIFNEMNLISVFGISGAVAALVFSSLFTLWLLGVGGVPKKVTPLYLSIALAYLLGESSSPELRVESEESFNSFSFSSFRVALLFLENQWLKSMR